jgi:hypothetical protein
MNLLGTNAGISLLTAATATGTTTVASGTIDLKGNPSVTFVTTLGTTNAGNNIRVQGGNASDGSDATDLAGSKITPTGTGPSVCILDAVRVPYRYARVFVTRAGATTTVGDIWAIQGSPSVKPVTNTGAAAFAVALVDPVAGTA